MVGSECTGTAEKIGERHTLLAMRTLIIGVVEREAGYEMMVIVGWIGYVNRVIPFD